MKIPCKLICSILRDSGDDRFAHAITPRWQAAFNPFSPSSVIQNDGQTSVQHVLTPSYNCDIVLYNSRTRAVGFHYETYGKISPSRSLSLFDFAVSDRCSYEKIHTASLGTARWADLGTRHHHIKPSPKGSPLGTRRWCDVDALTLIQRRNNVVCSAGRALCGELCWDDLISPYPIRCSMHIFSWT